VALDPYFEQSAVARAALQWAISTQQQLDRWEPLVALHLRQTWYRDEPISSLGIWQARTEHHFCLIAAAHLVKTLPLLDPAFKGVPQMLRDEIVETRDLLEHWLENQPIFRQRPQPRQPPRKSGQNYAARNPARSPYLGLDWQSDLGPLLTPNVSAAEVRALVERVEAVVIKSVPDLGRFIPAHVAKSPWTQDDSGWWPRPVSPTEPA
jgi:hypothetical protein